MRSNKVRLYFFLMLIFILGDSIYSSLQYYGQPLDGDMAAIILPAQHYKKILKNPLGLNAIIKNERYGGTNRFFAHWIESNFFKRTPAFLQKIFTPIKSVYLSSALLKIFVHISFLALLYVFLPFKSKKLKLLSICIAIPFFQTNGYNTYMGIIESSPTYTIFYSLACIFGISVIYLFHFIESQKPQYRIVNLLVLSLITIVAVLSGPLNAPILIVFISVYFILNHKNFQPFSIANLRLTIIKYTPYFIILILALYALYLGTFNIENDSSISMLQRYKRLPTGLFNLLFQKLGWTLLIGLLLTNYILILKSSSDSKLKILKLYKGLILFSIVYIILLPLGGYRSYRPFIIRRDVIVPITLGCIFLASYSSVLLFQLLKKRPLKIYIVFTFSLLTILMIADKPNFERNKGEKKALVQLQRTNTQEMALGKDCLLLSWFNIKNAQESKNKAKLIQFWGITKGQVLFYNKK